MRYIDGESYYTVSEIAAAAGVSAQTIRVWERTGAFRSRRTSGGHRLFDGAVLKAAIDKSATQRRNRTRTPEPVPDVPEGIASWEFAATGARIRAAREAAGLSQQTVAAQTGVSRSLISSIERGRCGMSVHVFSRIAEALDMPMSGFAPSRPIGQRLMRVAQRPRSVFPDGIVWEELAAPGHGIAPAIVEVPSGRSSGGMVTLRRENFVLMLDGSLTFELADEASAFDLITGDALVIPAGLIHSWANRGAIPTRAVWIEQIL